MAEDAWPISTVAVAANPQVGLLEPMIRTTQPLE